MCILQTINWFLSHEQQIAYFAWKIFIFLFNWIQMSEFKKRKALIFVLSKTNICQWQSTTLASNAVSFLICLICHLIVIYLKFVNKFIEKRVKIMEVFFSTENQQTPPKQIKIHYRLLPYVYWIFTHLQIVWIKSNSIFFCFL